MMILRLTVPLVLAGCTLAPSEAANVEARSQPSQALLTKLQSPDPIPDPIALPLPSSPEPDVRTVYAGHVRGHGLVPLVVRLESLERVALGHVAHVEILAGPKDVKRTEYLIPKGCNVGEGKEGDVLFVHVDRERALDEGAKVVPFVTTPVTSVLTPVRPSKNEGFDIDMPWSTESFQAIAEVVR